MRAFHLTFSLILNSLYTHRRREEGRRRPGGGASWEGLLEKKRGRRRKNSRRQEVPGGGGRILLGRKEEASHDFPGATFPPCPSLSLPLLWKRRHGPFPLCLYFGRSEKTEEEEGRRMEGSAENFASCSHFSLSTTPTAWGRRENGEFLL